MPNRFTTPLHRNSLKTHVRRLIALLGGIEAAATVTRSRLAEYADVHAQDRHMPIDILLDLELAAGDPLVTAQLAAAQGYVINPLQFGEGDVAEALARVSQTGTTLADAVQAIRDGLPAHRPRIDPAPAPGAPSGETSTERHHENPATHLRLTDPARRPRRRP